MNFDYKLKGWIKDPEGNIIHFTEKNVKTLVIVE